LTHLTDPTADIDVVVPSYQRPDALARCLEALGRQTLAPARLIVVARADDSATQAVAHAAQGTHRVHGSQVTLVTVTEPGVVAALSAAVAQSTASILAFTDDDAMPRPDWIERLLDGFVDPAVGAVGGRDVIPGADGPLTDHVGRFTRSGKLIGNHHLGTGAPRDVHVLKGVNMAFRAEALALPAAGALRGTGAQVDFEVLVCSWARRHRWRLVYDPSILVDHHPALRVGPDRRGRPAASAVFDAAYNSVAAPTLVERRELLRQAVLGIAIGSRGTPGVVRALAAVVHREVEVLQRVVPSLAGKIAASAQVLVSGDARPAVVTAVALRSPAELATRLLVVSHPAVLPVNQEVYAELVRRGWDIHIVVPDRWRHEFRADLFPPAALAGLEGRLHPMRIVLPGAPQRHAYIGRLSKVLATVRPDVVFLEQEGFSVSAAQWGRAAARRGIPFGIQAAENLDRELPLPARIFRRFTLGRAAFVAARSPAAASLVRQWGTRAAIDLVPHHVPAWPLQAPHGNRPYTVGYAGRLVSQKGLDVLVAAMRRLDSPARLLVAGDGPLRAWLESADLGQASLEVRTGVDHDEMADVYAEMDVLVLPSHSTPAWEEQFGRVLVEALWCGVPVVGSSSGEIPWVVTSTGGGLVFPEGDADALHDALIALRDDHDFRQRFATVGQERTQSTFAIPAVADRLAALVAAQLAPAPVDHRPHVALVAHGIHDHGGMEIACAELIRHLHHRVRFTVVSAELAPDLLPLIDHWARIRVPMRPIPLKFAAFFARAGLAVRRLDVDLVHTVGAIIPNRVDIAAIHHCHLGARDARRNAGPTTTSPLHRANTAITRAVAIAAERHSYTPAKLHRFAAVSAGVADEVRRHFPDVQIDLVPNGVDHDRFHPDAAARGQLRTELATGAAIVALFVGGDWPGKGVETAIGAVAAARAHGGDVVLWVVGVGDTRRATAAARALGIEQHVTFHGRRADTERFYAAADVFILPTAYETFSLVTLEAAASGLPVIVTAVHTWFGDDADGAGAIVVERNAPGFAAALTTLTADPRLRHELGERARRAAGAFTWARSAAANGRIYDELMADPTRKRSAR